MALKSLREFACRIRVQTHDQHAASAFVQTMHGIDMLPQLVAQRLHHEARLARVQPGSVHQPTGGFVHGHHVVVAPEQAQRRQGLQGSGSGFGRHCGEEDKIVSGLRA